MNIGNVIIYANHSKEEWLKVLKLYEIFNYDVKKHNEKNCKHVYSIIEERFNDNKNNDDIPNSHLFSKLAINYGMKRYNTYLDTGFCDLKYYKLGNNYANHTFYHIDEFLKIHDLEWMFESINFEKILNS